MGKASDQHEASSIHTSYNTQCNATSPHHYYISLIKDGLKNPNWNTSDFDPTQPEDIEDIKLIKQSISPKIKFDFIHLDDKDLSILKDYSII